ncbi:hypothetical protein ACFL0L_00110 [Patescibacteria group bacterium]
MKNNEPATLEKKLEDKAARRNRKRKPKMKISGKGVFTLQKLMKRSKRASGRKKRV